MRLPHGRLGTSVPRWPGLGWRGGRCHRIWIHQEQNTSDQCLPDAERILGTMLTVLRASHNVLSTACEARGGGVGCCYAHFMDETTEAQRIACPRSHSW